MPSNPLPDAATTRRTLLLGGLGVAGLGLSSLHSRAQSAPDVPALVRAGGVVVAFRHALAPGTFDPPQFRLGDCSTQRNLSEEGREQARRIGQWFTEQGLKPARVRSSPWCRCVDTANLAFGSSQSWAALGSPRGYSETTGQAHLTELRRELSAATRRAGQFEVWVTHMFVLSDLVQTNTSSGEALILRAGASGKPEVLARWSAPA